MASNQDQARVFVYTADGERLMSFDCAGGTCSEDSPPRETWTLRDLDGKVLRVYGHRWGSDWTWDRDYVHRDGLPLATVTPTGTRWLHLDHLGSTRLITDENGNETAEMAYYPYGEQAYESGVSDVELRFTGHERDDAAGVENDVLDYMHARYCSPVLGRFLRVDPLVLNASHRPALWNRYSYALNNPVSYTDPSGMVVKVLDDKAFLAILNTLPSEVRDQINLTPERLISADSLNQIESTDPNFVALKELVGRAETFEVSTMSKASDREGNEIDFFFKSRDEVIAELAPYLGLEQAKQNVMGPELFLGMFNPASESTTGNPQVIISDATGPASGVSVGEIAGTMAHELYGHALRWAKGQPWRHDQGGVVDKAIKDIQDHTTRMHEP